MVGGMWVAIGVVAGPEAVPPGYYICKVSQSWVNFKVEKGEMEGWRGKERTEGNPVRGSLPFYNRLL